MKRKEIIKQLNAHYKFIVDETIYSDSIEEIATIRIMKNYITDGPGFCGTLVFVVFNGDPSFHQVFGISSNKHKTVREYYNKLQVINQDTTFIT